MNENTNDHTDTLLSTNAVADLLNVKRGTISVWLWMKKYDLRPIKIGRDNFYKKSDIQQIKLLRSKF